MAGNLWAVVIRLQRIECSQCVTFFPIKRALLSGLRTLETGALGLSVAGPVKEANRLGRGSIKSLIVRVLYKPLHIREKSGNARSTLAQVYNSAGNSYNMKLQSVYFCSALWVEMGRVWAVQRDLWRRNTESISNHHTAPTTWRETLSTIC